MHENFLILKKYYQKAAQKIPENSFYQQIINHKFKHSVEVLHIGQKILQQTPELKNKSETFINIAEKSLLFHDIGRFKEAELQYKASLSSPTVHSTYDHGLLGYKQLKQQNNDIRLLFPIKWHCKTLEEIITSKEWQHLSFSPLFAETKQILFLVRDADKLANLHHIKKENHLLKDAFYQHFTNETLNAPLSPLVLEQFYSKQFVSLSDIYSFADRILMVISWIFDLNYKKTKQIFTKEKYADYLLDLLQCYHKNSDDIKKISNFIKKAGS